MEHKEYAPQVLCVCRSLRRSANISSPGNQWPEEFFTDPGGRQALPGGAQSFDNDSNVRNSLHRVNGGIEVNLGLTCPYGRNNFFIEGGGNYGFFNIQKNAVDGKNNTGAATVTLGYSYHLK